MKLKGTSGLSLAFYGRHYSKLGLRSWMDPKDVRPTDLLSLRSTTIYQLAEISSVGSMDFVSTTGIKSQIALGFSRPRIRIFSLSKSPLSPKLQEPTCWRFVLQSNATITGNGLAMTETAWWDLYLVLALV
ncbi:hypothetical protein VNO77_27263 [Canavalia gladiata]|uniref:Uncharacterized protein n=1 Tax=Canavalia gladiata TaxID=3824 RepID=A0AAN9KUD3_CANGL